MAAATDTDTPPARASALKRRSPTPQAPHKRKLTLAKAIDQWTETELAIKGLQELRDEAKGVLIAHAERTGKRTFKNRIAVVDVGGQLVLDQAAAVAFITEHGRKLRDFQKRAKRGLSLRLLST